ncbi:MAG: metallophosphoesterase [Sulfolobus sp.]|nr:metallophosphoesterase [Sulfolobus sp.]
MDYNKEIDKALKKKVKWLAVFGDIHGALEGMYKTVSHMEKAFEINISAVLQVGDMGVFPDLSRLDRATMRFFREDFSEAGAVDYIRGDKTSSHLTIFVRGNHEDFDFLKTKKNRFIDPANKIFHLYGGTINLDNVSIAGLGGIEPTNSGSRHSDNRWMYIDNRELSMLEKKKVDILLTHDGPLGYSLSRNLNAGSETILKLIKDLQPRFHFFGHYSRPPPPTLIGKTISVCLNLDEIDGVELYKVPNREASVGLLDVEEWKFYLLSKEFELIELKVD